MVQPPGWLNGKTNNCVKGHIKTNIGYSILIHNIYKFKKKTKIGKLKMSLAVHLITKLKIINIGFFIYSPHQDQRKDFGGTLGCCGKIFGQK